MKEFLRKYKHWVIVAFLLLCLVCFFSDPNIFEFFRIRARVNNLNSEIERYEEIIAEDSVFMYNLKHDNRFLEKYAREKHLMHSEDEQLFIVE